MSADVAEAQQIPQRVVSAWAVHDAEAFAGLFTEDATMVLPNDVFLSGRDKIREFMKEAFTTSLAGTRVTGQPVDAHPVSDDVVVIVTKGGVLAPGEAEVSADRAIYATWVLRRDEDWHIAAYQNTPRSA